MKKYWTFLNKLNQKLTLKIKKIFIKIYQDNG